MLGDRFVDRRRLAELLQSQGNLNTGDTFGGLAHVLQQYLIGRETGREMQEQQAAMEALTQGASAKPWVNPDTGETMGEAGGLAGAQYALSQLQGNPTAGRLSSQLMMQQLDRDEENRQWENRFNTQNQAQMERFRMEQEASERRFQQQLAAQRELAQMRQSQGPSAPGGYMFTPEGTLAPIPGGPADPDAPKPQKPLPVSAVKLIREDQEALMMVDALNDQLSNFSNMIASGDLNLSTVGNLISGARNYAGMSDENSRNYASFRATLEKMRNDSLRLNKGVQTEGDAQRAWNELIANINDEELVAQRLAEIQRINQRAAAIRDANIDLVYNSFGVERPGTQPQQAPQQFMPQQNTPPQNGGWSIQRID